MNRVYKNSFFAMIIINAISLPFQVKAIAEEKPSPQNFKYYSEIVPKVQNNSIIHFNLTEDILNKSENDFKDIRIFDSSSKEIPFIILNDFIPESAKQKFTLKIIDYIEVNQKDTIITEIDKTNNEDNPKIGKISFSTNNRNFNKKILVYGSNNKNRWTPLESDNIFDFSDKVDLRKDFIELKDSVSYKYYKFEINRISSQENNIFLKLNYKGLNIDLNEDKDNTFRIDLLSVETNPQNKEKKEFKITEIQPQIVNNNKKSVIELKNNLPVEKIEFNISNPYFYRVVNIYSKFGNQENLISKDYIYDIGEKKTDEKRYINIPNHKNIKIEIENLDNPSLDIKSIKTSRLQTNLFFISNSESNYKIYTGNKDIIQANYDTSNYVNQNNWYEKNQNKVSISKTVENTDFVNTFSNEDRDKIQKNVLIGIVFLIVIILGFWIYKMSKETSNI